MSERMVLERIDQWARAGLIDGETAERLRSAEGTAITPAAAPAPSGGGLVPALSITSLFVYLGSGFLLFAWYALAVRITADVLDGGTRIALASLPPAVALFVIGLVILQRAPGRRTAATIAWVLASIHLGVGAGGLAETAGLELNVTLVIGAAVWVAAAVLVRDRLPGLLTQAGLLLAITALSAAFLSLARSVLFGSQSGFDPDQPPTIVEPLLAAVWWAGTALLIGLIGLRESWSGTPAADRRAALSRIWAGFLLVIGVASAVTTSGFVGEGPAGEGEFGRLLEPWVADAILLGVAFVLLERAFRREASAFVYPAGLAVLIALSDLNASYLVERTSTEIGLLVEGVILLAAGLAVDRFRRRVGRGSPATPDVTLEAPVGG